MSTQSTKLIDHRHHEIPEVIDFAEPAKVEIQKDRIDIYFQNDRSIWIEQEDGVIKVHCYGPGNDEPTSIRLSRAGLTLVDP